MVRATWKNTDGYYWEADHPSRWGPTERNRLKMSMAPSEEVEEEGSSLSSPEAASNFSRAAAWLNSRAQDRPDIATASCPSECELRSKRVMRKLRAFLGCTL